MTKDSGNHSTEEERFISFLNSQNLRKTPERIEILKNVLDYTGHFGVEDLYNRLDKKGYHVSRQTVYNTLELLCEAGIIKRLLFDSLQALYELTGRDHTHLICTACGKVKETESPDIEKQLNNLKSKEFYPSYITVSVYGLCEECMKKQSSD